MTVVLTALSALAVLLLFAALAVYLLLIIRELEAIGGAPTSYLAKIRFGVRAIEQETSALAPQVTKLNQGLAAVAGGLKEIDRSLASVVEALKRQEGLS